MKMETKTIKDIEAGEKFEWAAEVTEMSIPTLEIVLPDYIIGYLGLNDGDRVVFCETKAGDENAVIMKRAKREC